jgi:hypothetical protein
MNDENTMIVVANISARFMRPPELTIGSGDCPFVSFCRVEPACDHVPARHDSDSRAASIDFEVKFNSLVLKVKNYFRFGEKTFCRGIRRRNGTDSILIDPRRFSQPRNAVSIRRFGLFGTIVDHEKNSVS